VPLKAFVLLSTSRTCQLSSVLLGDFKALLASMQDMRKSPYVTL